MLKKQKVPGEVKKSRESFPQEENLQTVFEISTVCGPVDNSSHHVAVHCMHRQQARTLMHKKSNF